MELWRLFAHRHWFSFSIIGLEIRLCSRCSGYVMGLIFALIGLRVLDLSNFFSLTIYYQILFSSTLSIPMICDWLTQSWGLRNSNNQIRLITGFFLGIGTLLYSTINVNFYLKIISYIVFVSMIVIFSFVGRR
jgi:uncharacterized membrane protein